MYFRHKAYPWVGEPLRAIPLAHGTFLIWRTSRGPHNEQRDDWREKHMIDWAKQCEEGFVDKDPEDKERVAIVMRITNEKADGWYATQHPYRVVARAGRP